MYIKCKRLKIMMEKVKEYRTKKRIEKFDKRYEQMREVMKRTPAPNREKLREESRLFIEELAKMRKERGECVDVLSDGPKRE